MKAIESSDLIAIAALALSVYAIYVSKKSIRSSVMPALTVTLDKTEDNFFPKLHLQNAGKGTAFAVRMDELYDYDADRDEALRLAIEVEPMTMPPGDQVSAKMAMLNPQGKAHFDKDYGSHVLTSKGWRGVLYRDQHGAQYRTQFYFNDEGNILKTRHAKRYWQWQRIANSAITTPIIFLKHKVRRYKYVKAQKQR